jgi:hypothetical protein
VSQCDWQLPSRNALLDVHVSTRRPLWREILSANGRSVGPDDSLSDHLAAVEASWLYFLQLMPRWQFKRCFNRVGASVKCKTRAAVVVVHPVGRFAIAQRDAQWRDACYWTLLAHCNRGQQCATFRDAYHLDTLSDQQLDDLVALLVAASPEERSERRIAQCPPRVRKNWQLGVARKQRQEERKHSHAKVASSMTKVTFLFREEIVRQNNLYADIDSEEQVIASKEWRQAEVPSSTNAEQGPTSSAEDSDIRDRTKAFVTETPSGLLTSCAMLLSSLASELHRRRPCLITLLPCDSSSVMTRKASSHRTGRAARRNESKRSCAV